VVFSENTRRRKHVERNKEVYRKKDCGF
jgi:hypothetical protein